MQSSGQLSVMLQAFFLSLSLGLNSPATEQLELAASLETSLDDTPPASSSHETRVDPTAPYTKFMRRARKAGKLFRSKSNERRRKTADGEWEDLQQNKLPPCGNAPAVFDGTWAPYEGGIGQWTPKTCALRRFKWDEVVQCLKNKRMIFIGDSVTRYQYMSMAMMLHTKNWPTPIWDGAMNPCYRPHEMNWNAWYAHSGALFGGKETCDCFRPEGDDHVALAPQMFENRYFRDAGNALSISYFQDFTKGIHGHETDPTGFGKVAPPCSPGACNQPAAFEVGLAGFMSQVMKPMNPNYLIINRGIWGEMAKVSPTEQAAIIQAGNAAVSSSSGTVFWKSTGFGREGSAMNDGDFYNKAALSGWGLHHVLQMSSTLKDIDPTGEKIYCDKVWHYQPWVYQEFNTVLLNQIC